MNTLIVVVDALKFFVLLNSLKCLLELGLELLLLALSGLTLRYWLQVFPDAIAVAALRFIDVYLEMAFDASLISCLLLERFLQALFLGRLAQIERARPR